MEQMNFHKQKLYALIIAAVALISMLLPWLTINVFIASKSFNGFNSWGWLSFIGILAAGGLSLTGNREQDYSAEYKKYIMAAFGAIALGAILVFIRKTSIDGGIYKDVIKTGIGLWICLVAGLAGLALNYGLIKIESKPAGTANRDTNSTTTTVNTTSTNTTVQP